MASLPQNSTDNLDLDLHATNNGIGCSQNANNHDANNSITNLHYYSSQVFNHLRLSQFLKHSQRGVSSTNTSSANCGHSSRPQPISEYSDPDNQKHRRRKPFWRTQRESLFLAVLFIGLVGIVVAICVPIVVVYNRNNASDTASKSLVAVSNSFFAASGSYL